MKKYIIFFMSIFFLLVSVCASFAEITAVGKSRDKYIYKIGGVFVLVSEGDIIDGCLVSSSGLICDNNLKIEIESHDYCSKYVEEALKNKDCSAEISASLKNAEQRFDNRLKIEMMKSNEDCSKKVAEAIKTTDEDCSKKVAEAIKITEENVKKNCETESDKDYKIKALKEALRRCWNRITTN